MMFPKSHGMKLFNPAEREADRYSAVLCGKAND